MNKIETYSNWCEIDRLDGKDLKDGERLSIKWPSGTITTETIIVKKHKETVSDMGHPWDAPFSKAYVKGTINGVPVEVPIAGLRAVRV